MIEGSVPLTSGSRSGSGRPKNMWIRWIRIRNTAKNKSLLFVWAVVSKFKKWLILAIFMYELLACWKILTVSFFKSVELAILILTTLTESRLFLLPDDFRIYEPNENFRYKLLIVLLVFVLCTYRYLTTPFPVSPLLSKRKWVVCLYVCLFAPTVCVPGHCCLIHAPSLTLSL